MSPLLLLACCLATPLVAEEATPEITVPRCEDFTITGRGDAAAWDKAPWVQLQRRPGNPREDVSRFKLLYSGKGLYVLFDGDDRRLTATMTEDFLDLWKEDVFECFLWPHEEDPIYFEYEISPLGYELPILVPNLEGRFLGWRPWRYEGQRLIQKKVSASGGETASLARVTGWRAEIFIPYAVLEPLRNVPPQAGTRWRANFYRVDYDDEQTASWDWSRVGPSFHEFRRFGRLVFQ